RAKAVYAFEIAGFERLWAISASAREAARVASALPSFPSRQQGLQSPESWGENPKNGLLFFSFFLSSSATSFSNARHCCVRLLILSILPFAVASSISTAVSR